MGHRGFASTGLGPPLLPFKCSARSALAFDVSLHLFSLNGMPWLHWRWHSLDGAQQAQLTAPQCREAMRL